MDLQEKKNESLELNKAQLAKGFTPRECKFSPSCEACYYSYGARAVGYQNNFLYGELEEIIYMK